MKIKDLVEILSAWPEAAEVEIYKGMGDGPYEIISIYSDNSPGSISIPGTHMECKDMLVTIDVEKPE